MSQSIKRVMRKRPNALQKMQQTANKALKLIEQVEKKYNFDSGVRTIISIPWDNGFYLPKAYPIIGNTLKIPTTRNPKLKEFVYHELGHAIHDHFELRGYLKPFVKKSQKTMAEYISASERAAGYDRLPGFVSGYARCNREEDFCETLSAYLINQKTWRNYIVYDGERISLRGDKKLKEKLQIIHDLLHDLEVFE